MARYSESPSPPQRPCERGRRGAFYQEGPPDEDEYDRRVVERSARGHRGSMRGRGEMLAQPRSPSRSRSPYQAQRPPPEDREPRRRRHAADVDGRPRHRRSERPPVEAQHESPELDHGRQQAEMQPRPRTRRSERDVEGDGPERSRGRRRDKGHDDQQKMSEMQRMMMSGMMHPAAMQMAMMQQMGHMGMMHPSYMAAMQQQQKKTSKREKRKRDKPPGVPGGPSSESSSSDSSSDSSAPGGGALGPAAMAAMAAMHQQWASMGAQPPHGQPPHAMPPHPAQHHHQQHRSGRPPRGGMPPPPPPPPPPGSTGGTPYSAQPGASDEDIEAYLAGNPVEEDAADRLRALPPHLAAAVIARGPVSDSRDPTAVLLARLRAVEINRPPGEVPKALSAVAAPRNDTKTPAAENTATARSSIKQTIETMIGDYRLSVGCAWTMRALPPDKQKLAAKIDPAGQADPSAYVAEELRKIV